MMFSVLVAGNVGVGAADMILETVLLPVAVDVYAVVGEHVDVGVDVVCSAVAETVHVGAAI